MTHAHRLSDSQTHPDDDYQFQLREWRVQRFGLAALAVLVAASALGVVGSPDTIVRVVTIYGFLLLVFRIAGKRTVAQLTSFDLIVLLIIGDATQQGLIGEDFSITTAMVAVSCLILVDIALGRLKSQWRTVDRLIDSVPLILIFKGRILEDRMAREGVDLEDILEEARSQHGILSVDEIEFAVLERHGGISVIPRDRSREGGS